MAIRGLTKIRDFRYGCLFRGATAYIFARTVFGLDALWKASEDEYYYNDEDQLSFIATVLPRDFEAFRAVYGDADWDEVVEVGNRYGSEVTRKQLEDLTRAARFAEGERAAVIYVKLLEMLMAARVWDDFAFYMDASVVETYPAKDIRQLFALKHGESL